MFDKWLISLDHVTYNLHFRTFHNKQCFPVVWVYGIDTIVYGAMSKIGLLQFFLQQSDFLAIFHRQTLPYQNQVAYMAAISNLKMADLYRDWTINLLQSSWKACHLVRVEVWGWKKSHKIPLMKVNFREMEFSKITIFTILDISKDRKLWIKYYFRSKFHTKSNCYSYL